MAQPSAVQGAGAAAAMPVPQAVDLRAALPAPFDQRGSELCVPAALAAVLACELAAAGRHDACPVSLLFLDYETHHGPVPLPPGPVDMADGLSAVERSGVCSEALWPFDPARRDERPPAPAYAFAQGFRGIRFRPVAQERAAILSLLAAGHPFVCALRIFQSFWSPRTRARAAIPMPLVQEREVGGHAVAVTGYDQSRDIAVIRNSFGGAWGDCGYAALPFDYLLSRYLAFDLWAVDLAGIAAARRHPGPATG